MDRGIPFVTICRCKQFRVVDRLANNICIMLVDMKCRLFEVRT